MGRAADALDWTEEGSGVGLRALTAYPTEGPTDRPGSERSLRAETPTDPANVIQNEIDEFPVLYRETYDEAGREAGSSIEIESGIETGFEMREGYADDAAEPLSTRGIARLSALADWIEGEAPTGAVVTLVRAFLQEMDDVGLAVAALASAGEAFGGPELVTAIESLKQAIETWRGNLVEHVDDLAITEHRSFSGWASLPEYSSAFTLAIVRPAIAEADGWAALATVRRGIALAPLVQAVLTAVDRVNSTLRTAILGPSERDERDRFDGPLSTAAW
jgi:hypothetical protein